MIEMTKMTEEIWKPVERFDSYVEVSNLGRARRTERPLTYKDGRNGILPAGLLRGSLGKNGYYTISYGHKKILLHRIVAEAFLEPPSNKFATQTVNHINGIKTDNRIENLEWATYKHNNDHARKSRLNNQCGENTNFSKYSDQLVCALKNVHSEYSPTAEKLAELFNMPISTVRDILTGRSRKDR